MAWRTAIRIALAGCALMAAPARAGNPGTDFQAIQTLYRAQHYPQAFNAMLQFRQTYGRTFFTDLWLARIACSFAEKRPDGLRLLKAMQADYAPRGAGAVALANQIGACGGQPGAALASNAAAASINSTSASPHRSIPAFDAAAGASSHSRPTPPSATGRARAQ